MERSGRAGTEPAGPRYLKRLLTALLLVAGVLGPLLSAASPALATETLGGKILGTAETRAGDWYAWGGAGPNVFDCSGLVMWAAARHGVSLPHNTVLMVHNWHLVRTWHPQRGDVAAFGPVGAPYHVELVTIWYHVTFGAHHSGTRVGYARYFPPGYAPTAYYRIR